jgi:hypothetical protein
VHRHGRHQSGVVDLNALDGMRDNELPPERVGCRVFGQDREQPLDDAQPPVGLGDRQAKPTAGPRGPRTDVPEFGRILGRRAQRISLTAKRPDGLSHGQVLRVGALKQPKQDAAIDENHHQS